MTSTDGHGPALAAAERALAAIGEPDDQRVWIARIPAETVRERARALDAAAAAGTRLPLHGTTFAVKGNLDVAGLPTTAACPAFAYEPAQTATVVARLEQAGALLLGTTNLDQFATGVVGTRSPYGAPSAVDDAQRISGGSSSGSAVAVARGEVDFALGTDTAGSGRVPAAFNGLVGTKPSRGLLSTAGLVPACRSLDCVSILTADAALARRVLDVADAPDPADAYSRADRAPRGGGALPPRLAIPTPAALAPLDAPSRAAWDATIAQAGARGAELVEVEIEPLLAAGRLLYEGPWVAERFAAVGAFVKAAAAGEPAPAASQDAHVAGQAAPAAGRAAPAASAAGQAESA
ncbi:amidase family protein, partial [Conexibacter sp. JD483]|uniref:amidase family protein n=1 Tax=Conexibacter sp. JD483 TaxID=3064471 RepID=UPI00286FF6D0